MSETDLWIAYIYICTLQYTFQHCTMCSSFLYSNTKSVFFIMSCTFFPNRKKQWSLHKFVKQMCWPSLSAALHWQAEKTWIKRFYGSTAIHPNTNIPLPPTKKPQTGAVCTCDTALSTWYVGTTFESSDQLTVWAKERDLRKEKKKLKLWKSV